ncbi:class I SAM-dependent methyltransferase [Pantoea sp. Aalb]|uniref:class I SAM-dependent methyltransferase n=1 Tax=Pantoea sp. Aalb TaxID=2576762 RepID=UPI00132B09B1|nr:class I SAM-dependent methyltransferase [Pantoea sp. Aalb]MXP67610.1 class I SAM-dependent methyltransferase [Pantoea sp. Aalb]
MKPAKTQQMLIAPRSWSDIPWGNHFCEALTQQLKPFLVKLYGFHMLKIGLLSAEINTSQCNISHQINIGNEGDVLQVIANTTQLPFDSKSIDVCLLAHTLAWSQDPHMVLREVDRVLIDDGWIIISGFNPFSLLGLSKGIPGFYQRIPWNGRMFSQLRLLDWLSLLNYEITHCMCCQVLPWYKQERRKIMNKHLLSVFGCLNIVVGRKRTFPLIPLRNKKNLNTTTKMHAPINATSQ